MLVFNVGPVDQADPRRTPPTGLVRERCAIPGDLLNDGAYRVVLEVVLNGRRVHQWEDVLAFEVQDAAETRDGWYEKWSGVVRPRRDWNTEVLETHRRRPPARRRRKSSSWGRQQCMIARRPPARPW
ncbi:MAG: hypothetical protein WKH64_13625 [Chloroflexia bacterium]